ncbi:MAG TPA: TIGR02594 family protein [Steroidobacteraceae bacterium]|nr:TIGR02594 family protein [Steroidobacteraceae bacterium]
MTEPTWLTHARTYLGTAEIPGKQTAPVIARWLRELKGWWSDDETPWCGTFVGAVLRESGLPVVKHWYRAKDWLNWGIPIADAAPGCVVVYDRTGGGHVGFAVARDTSDRILTLGGNQGNRVSIAPFPRWRVLGYRWPEDRVAELAAAGTLPVVVSGDASSGNEA